MASTGDDSTGETKPVLVIAGPTASGKSALALEVARQADGVVINADSMQVYQGLRILTARPTPEDEAAAPHRLYGWLAPDDVCSAGRWAEAALAEIRACHATGRLPIICGGTGFYIETLMRGLPPAPHVPEDVRAAARADVAADYDGLYAALAEADPETAARIRDPQRLARAIEVWRATDRIPSKALGGDPTPPSGIRFRTVVVMPPRDRLYARIDARAEAMAAAGAAEEAAVFMARGLDPTLPAMKAVGLREFSQATTSEILLHEAIQATAQASRRYAKRQITWLRRRLRADELLELELNSTLCENFALNRLSNLLTP